MQPLWGKCRSQKRLESFEDWNGATSSGSFKKFKSEDRDKNECDDKKGDVTVKHITNESDDDYVFCIASCVKGGEVSCKIGGVTVDALIDSGSRYNLMSQAHWEQLKAMEVVVSDQHKETEKVFKAYGGHVLPVLGAFKARRELPGKIETADFYVIRGDGKLLIGHETATLMSVLKIDCGINKIETDKQGDDGDVRIGKMKNVLVEIPLRPNVKPVVQPYRRVPVPLEKAVDQKIEELLRHG